MKIKASFDDGSLADKRVADLLVKYGISDCTFYIPVNWSALNKQNDHAPLSVDQIKQLATLFDIGSHTISHPLLTRIPMEVAFAEIVQSKIFLSEFIGKEITKFCYPRGYANDEIRQIVRNHYKEARNTIIGCLHEATDPIWSDTTVHVAGNRRKDYEQIHWLNYARNMIANAKEQEAGGTEAIYHFWGHGWEIERYDEWNNFETFLQELTA